LWMCGRCIMGVVYSIAYFLPALVQYYCVRRGARIARRSIGIAEAYTP
jgi:hypothetical protein